MIESSFLWTNFRREIQTLIPIIKPNAKVIGFTASTSGWTSTETPKTLPRFSAGPVTSPINHHIPIGMQTTEITKIATSNGQGSGNIAFVFSKNSLFTKGLTDLVALEAVLLASCSLPLVLGLYALSIGTSVLVVVHLAMLRWVFRRISVVGLNCWHIYSSDLVSSLFKKKLSPSHGVN